MANALTFLKNYRRFGYKIRLITAKTYLEKFQSTDDSNIKKVMMLRIIEELVSSTEDLAMWLAALNEQNEAGYSSNIRDVWDYLLLCEATDEKIIKILKSLARKRTARGLYRTFKLPSLEEIALFCKEDNETIILALFENLLKAIKSSLHNRTVTRKVLLRFHNKVKHGMMVQDYNSDLYIRDLRIKKNSEGRIIRINRNLYLKIDEEKAKKMIGTIEVNLAAIHFIVILFMCVYGYAIKRKKESGKKFSKKEMLFIQESLKDYSKP